MAQGESPQTVALPSLAAWQEAVGTAFTVRTGGLEPLGLTLTEVAVSDRKTGWESFVLRFSAPLALAQGTYAVEHDGLGAFSLFLVTVESDEDTPQCEAVFNRPAP